MSISTEPKNYARAVLTDRGESRNFIRAVAAYLDAEAYTQNNIGSPDYNLLRAQRDIAKLHLPDSEVSRAIDIAKFLYREFVSTPTEDLVTTQTRTEKARKNGIKNRLKQRFQKLMSYTDDEIQRLNSNQNMNLFDDIAYSNADGESKRKIRYRSLPESEYNKLLLNATQTESDLFSIDVSNIDKEADLISRAKHILSRDAVLQRQLNDWPLFEGYVIRLLKGEILSRTEVQANRIPADTVLRKAKGIRNAHLTYEAHCAWDIPLPSETRINPRTAVDPQLYEKGRVVRRKM